MTVKELISIFKELPPDMEVYFEITPKGSTDLHFKSIDEVSVIKTSEGEDFVGLFCGAPLPNINLN